jgi:uncharacterized membrane protein
MKTLPRMHKHLITGKSAGRRAFPPATLAAIQNAIAEGEQQHRAEIRVVIEPALAAAAVLRGVPARERAKELFSHYQIWDTEENCGILVYVNIADHKVEIVADRTVARLLSAKEWQSVCATMTRGFAHGEFHHSALTALRQLNGLLQERFPNKDDGAQANQLPDRPIVL